jgi:hypothetical protein
MKKLYFIIMILCCCIATADANGAGSVSPAQSGMGGTCLARYNTAAVQMINPALMDILIGSSLAMNFSRFYNLSELDQISLAVSHDLEIIDIGIAFTNQGEAGFWTENMIAASLSKTIISRIAFGLKLEIHRVSFDERFESLDMLSIAAGAAYVDDDFVIHAALSDINKPRYSDSDSKTEPGYRIGASINSISPLVINFEVTGCKDDDQRFSFGQEINFEEKLFVRFGLITNPTLPSAGFGLMLNQFRFDYSINRHTVLGNSHNLGISISL